MIKIENLKKNFGETCACDIPSFTINDGDILGLVGNNGAGKTTLFRLLLDLLKADDGSVCYILPSSDGEGQETESVNPAESEACVQVIVFASASVSDDFGRYHSTFVTPEPPVLSLTFPL